MITLNNAKSNIPLRIISIARGTLCSKLTDMGLIPGQLVMVLFKAPLGDPLAVEVGNYVLSLRDSEARLIEVQAEEMH